MVTVAPLPTTAMSPGPLSDLSKLPASLASALLAAKVTIFGAVVADLPSSTARSGTVCEIEVPYCQPGYYCPIGSNTTVSHSLSLVFLLGLL